MCCVFFWSITTNKLRKQKKKQTAILSSTYTFPFFLNIKQLVVRQSHQMEMVCFDSFDPIISSYLTVLLRDIWIECVMRLDLVD